MKRLAAASAVALVLPLVAWRVVSAEPTTAPSTPPVPAVVCDPNATTTMVPATTLVPTVPTIPTVPTVPVECLPTTTVAPTVPPTTLDPNAPTTTTLDPNAPTTTTLDPNAPTTIAPDPNATTTVPVEPNGTTTVPVDPAVTTPLDPGITVPGHPPPVPPATTDPAAPPTDPAAPAGTPPAPTEVTPPTVPEDAVSAPVVPVPRPPSGRSVVASGVVETGQARPIIFPVAGPVRYFNDFGACRAGCSRQHRGNDLIGDRLQPLLAMREGVVDRLLDHPTAGYGVVIEDAEGWEYHIYHVNNDTPGTDDGADDGSWRFTPGVQPGARVLAGQVIAWMGDSGNSEGSVPHAHVEIHMPSGAAINPFWSLRMAQRDLNCAIPVVTVPDAAALAPVSLADLSFLATGWSAPETVAELPGEWIPLSLTGGRPGSDRTAARMWVGPAGFTPVDAAAIRVGDPRYDEDCTQPSTAAAPPAPAPAAIPAELGAILATIRTLESGGNYTAQSRSSTASGAYQFLNGTWDGYGGYQRARDAPPAVQDAKAAELATYILNRNGGDVAAVPVSWYIGHVPRGAEWDTVPPVGSNVLTPRQYLARWMTIYARVLGTPEAWVTGGPPAWLPLTTTVTCRTVVIDVGQPDQPQYALTQARVFTGTPAGRAVPAPGDPCDPTRAPVAAPPVQLPILRPGGVC